MFSKAKDAVTSRGAWAHLNKLISPYGDLTDLRIDSLLKKVDGVCQRETMRLTSILKYPRLRQMTDPTAAIVSELIARLDHRDFTPFAIVLSDGSREEIPSADHCTVTRLLRRIEIERDDGKITILNPLHITKLELLHKPAA